MPVPIAITALPAAGAITGAEILPLMQDGVCRQSALIDLLFRQPGQTFEAFDDFNGNSSVNFPSNLSGTGAAISSSAIEGEPNHPGIMQLTTGTDTTGRCGLFGSGSAIRLGGGAYEAHAMLRVPVLSNATDRFYVYGCATDALSVESTDGVYFRYLDSVNGGKWECVTRNSSTETAVDSGIAVAAATWYGLKVAVNAAGTSAGFWISVAGAAYTLVATITTNIPTAAGRGITACSTQIRKALGTTARTLDVDYMYAKQRFTTARIL